MSLGSTLMLGNAGCQLCGVAIIFWRLAAGADAAVSALSCIFVFDVTQGTEVFSS